MLTDAKRNLINECLLASSLTPNRVFYGFIDKNGKVDNYPWSEESCVKARLDEGCRIYCKAKNGYLIL